MFFQDCSDTKHDGKINSIKIDTNQSFCEDTDDIDDELVATMIIQSPGIFKNVPGIRWVEINELITIF